MTTGDTNRRTGHKPPPPDGSVPKPGGLETAGVGNREQARAWLHAASQAPSAARVEELAPLVGLYPPGTPASEAAHQLLCSGNLPSPEAVERRLQEQARHRHDTSQRRQAVREAAQRLLEPDGPRRPEEPVSVRAVSWVRDYAREHHRRPTWAELRSAMGWPRTEGEAAIQILCASGHLAAGHRRARSLRPGPHAP